MLFNDACTHDDVTKLDIGSMVDRVQSYAVADTVDNTLLAGDKQQVDIRVAVAADIPMAAGTVADTQ